jgi:hypothetical protein
MSAIRATWQNGEVVLEGKPNWSEGRQLVVVELPHEESSRPDEEWPNTPEAIADWLKWYDSLEPLVITEDEARETEAWLKKMDEHAITKTDKDIEDIFR